MPIKADAVFVFGICVIVGFVLPCFVSCSKLFYKIESCWYCSASLSWAALIGNVVICLENNLDVVVIWAYI